LNRLIDDRAGDYWVNIIYHVSPLLTKKTDSDLSTAARPSKYDFFYS
jgi:hypothetical protein